MNADIICTNHTIERKKKKLLISNLPKLTIAINNSFTKTDQQKATLAPSPEIQFSDVTK
jgi:hypothetical protein